jgi:hypothetical protein
MTHCQGHCAELLLYGPGEHKRAVLIEDPGEPPEGLGEKGCLDQSGFVLERDELHGLAFLRRDDLFGGKKAGDAHTPADMAPELSRLDDTAALEAICK